MNSTEYPAKLILDSKKMNCMLNASIEPRDGYLYIYFKYKQKFPHLKFFVTPFTTSLIEDYSINVDDGVEIHFTGNNLGHLLSQVSSHPESTREAWSITNNQINIDYFKNGITISLKGSTERGESRFNYSKEILKTLDPINFELTFFISITDLPNFLNVKQSNSDPTESINHLMKMIEASSVKEY